MYSQTPKNLGAQSCLRRIGLISLGFLLAGPWGCNDSGGGGGQSSGAPQRTLSGNRLKVRAADNFLINYGPLDADKIALAKNYQVVVLHPRSAKLTRQMVQEIQRGNDPNDPSDDVIVLGYISVGEDLRTFGLTDEEMLHDPRFTGDRSGPRIDPRGHLPDGGPLDGIDPRGDPSTGGTGYASWYLDDNSVDRNGVGDGKPDRNAQFGACFVNAGDPAWFDVVDGMTMDKDDGLAGLREILTQGQGRGLGCDGVFLDTFDTCAPNQFTNASSPNQSEFEWTAPGFAAFLKRVRQTYPNAVILQNRGLFFFDPRHPHYKFTTRSNVDVVLFESFRLNSNFWETFNPYFFGDNRYNIAPKLMAEANRPDGFRVISLGYAAGPSDQISPATLTGGSALGFDLLIEDIRVAEEENGFRHYLSDAKVQLVNDFVRQHAHRLDKTPPVWSSTFNIRSGASPPGAPDPRAGIQEVVAGPHSLTVRWDVALDLNPVRYALYLQAQPFDFAADPNLTGARKIELSPSIGADYADGPGPTRYPYQATVGGLESGRTYYLILRAADTSPDANEEKNTMWMTGTPF